jgi:tRNA G26 N,N-dimethylase Trm1
MLIYILESDEAATGNNPKEKLVSSFGSETEFRSVKEIIDITATDKTAIYVSSLQSLGETKQDIMDSLNYISEKGVRIIIGDVTETMKQHPDITKVVTVLYRMLAYKDYKKRVIKQKQKIKEMKQDEEKWKSYGRKQKLTMDEFASVYNAVLRGELSAKQGQQALSISKRTYYKYKELYEKEYTND